MKNLIISENQLNRLFLTEDVFIGDVKGKKAKLTYNKRQPDARTRNKGNYNSSDMLKTDKMDQDNADTYVVPLKGGIDSYNITSIKGTEVMHYFKNKWSKKQTNISLDVNGQKKEFELDMEDTEFQQFLQTFVKKVSNVVEYVSQNLAKNDKNFKGFSGISIYPVPSSSNFNESMARILAQNNISVGGLTPRIVDTHLFEKDLSDLERDEDFINKNREYYESPYFKGENGGMTHLDVVNSAMDKFKRATLAQSDELVNEYNKWIDRTIQSYYTKSSPQTIAKNYENAVQAEKKIREAMQKLRWEHVFNLKKYAKGPSVEKRTKEIQAIVASVKGKTYIWQNPLEMVNIEKQNFQMKNLTNDTRMGLRNYFKAQEGIEEEVARIKGTIFVIFDDNISGGATLSDICYQAKKLGIEYIVPITFGEMGIKYQQGTAIVNRPEKWNFEPNKLNVLWLDDMRDPNKYFNKKSQSGAFVRNKQFYDQLMSRYNVNFIWVKNYEEFTNFILQNGLPQFVSFDHDLGAGLKKGLDCANWLIEYCRKTGNPLPKFFVHSANPNGQREINAVLNNASTQN